MSREYSRISPRFWIGETGRRIRGAGPAAQVVALYLLTSPHANMLGLYYLPLPHLSYETGIPLKGASKALQGLVEIGFCDYDHEAACVWVFEMARYQVGESLVAADKRCKGVQNEYGGLPSNRFLDPFFAKYGEPFHMKGRRHGASKPLASTFRGASEGLRSQEQEQAQEQAHATEPASALRGAVSFPGEKEKPSASRFVPPTLEELKSYVGEHKLNVNPAAFIDHFTSVGWRVGGNKPMKDWESAARTWSHRQNERQPQQQPKVGYV